MCAKIDRLGINFVSYTQEEFEQQQYKNEKNIFDRAFSFKASIM